MNELTPNEMVALRTQMLSLAVAAYDKGLTNAKGSPIELAELYMNYVLGTLAE